MKTLHFSILVLVSILLVPLSFAYGDNSFTTSRATTTDKLIVRFTVENTHQYAGNFTKIDLVFVKIGTYYDQIKNIDYRINIYYNNTSPQQQNIIYSSSLNHTLDGKASILYQFPKSGFYLVGIYVNKIFDMSIPEESVFFDFNMLNLPSNSLSPHKQFHYGISPYKVSCKNEFELFIKSEHNMPACVKPQTSQILKDRNWGYPVGKDIVLDKPSDITKSSYKLDPQKEKMVREKQKILEDALIAEQNKHGGFQNRTYDLSWSAIGYDYVDHALEVSILPDFFNTDNLPKYFEKIRNIVGHEIDIALSPMAYANLT